MDTSGNVLQQHDFVIILYEWRACSQTHKSMPFYDWIYEGVNKLAEKCVAQLVG